jgi:hypothetical protein
LAVVITLRTADPRVGVGDTADRASGAAPLTTTSRPSRARVARGRAKRRLIPRGLAHGLLVVLRAVGSRRATLEIAVRRAAVAFTRTTGARTDAVTAALMGTAAAHPAQVLRIWAGRLGIHIPWADRHGRRRHWLRWGAHGRWHRLSRGGGWRAHGRRRGRRALRRRERRGLSISPSTSDRCRALIGLVVYATTNGRALAARDAQQDRQHAHSTPSNAHARG